MALINRFTRLFSADLHAVLDQIEEPEVLLKQAIREMADELEQRRAQAEQLGRDIDRLVELEAESSTALTDLETKLDICFDAGQDALARGVLKRKLETEHHLRAVSTRRRHAEESLNALRGRIADNENDLVSMRQKADLLIPPRNEFEAREAVPRGFTASDEDIEVAFLREQQRRTTT